MSGLRHLVRTLLIVALVAVFDHGRAVAAAGGFPAATGASFRDCPDCPPMMVLPLGQFMMGSPPTERRRFDNEGPQHLVRVTRQVAIGLYPVTGGEFAAFSGAQPRPGEERAPAVMLTWFDAARYAAWLSQKTGHRYRLPTEAEYEYAERAGTTTAYSWGETVGKGNANCMGCGSALDGTGSTPVGSFPPNRFGLYDMAGDVFEWVEDCYVDTFDNAPSEAHIAREAASGACTARTLRASSWFNLPSFLRSAYRFLGQPDAKSARRGFRLVREADAP